MNVLGSLFGSRRVNRHPHVGIDVGHRVVKAVTHSAAGLRSQCVRWDGGGLAAGNESDDPSGRLAEVIRNATARFGLHSNATAYCVPSLGLGEFRSLELPVGTNDETREMIRLELADDGSTGDFEFAWWATPTPGEMQSIGAWRLDHSVGTTIDSACRQAGLECVGIDAVPRAAARLVASESFESPVAVVDCAAAHPSITIVHRGRPCYTRLLRDCGAERISDSLREGLGLSDVEAAEFVEQAAATDSPFATPECRQLVGEYATKTAGRLVDEVQRTLEYVTRRLPEIVPTKLHLLGGAVDAYETALRDRFADRVGVADHAGQRPQFAMAGSLLELEVQP